MYDLDEVTEDFDDSLADLARRRGCPPEGPQERRAALRQAGREGRHGRIRRERRHRFLDWIADTCARRSTSRARELGLDVEVTTLDRPTRTVQEAASAVGCQDGEIAKSLVFVCDGDPVLVVASGAHRVDMDKVADILDCAEVRQATPDEVRVATGFPSAAWPRSGTTCR